MSLKAAYAASLPPPPRPHFPNSVVVEEVIPGPTDKPGSQIREFTVVPVSRIGHVSLQLPRLRRIIWRRRRHDHEYNVRPITTASNREAVLIQTRGQDVYSGDDMCTRCQREVGPFTTCVVARTRDEESPRSGACANCVWRNHHRACSHRQTIKRDTAEGGDKEWQYESSGNDDDDDYYYDDDEEEEEEEEESFLPTPSRSPRSRGTCTTSRTNKAARKRPSKRDSIRNSRTTRGKAPKPKPLTPPRAKRPLCPAVVIPSPSLKREATTTTPAGQKYFKIPPGLSPNTAEDIRRALDELNVVRTRLFSRLEMLEAVQLVNWE
ncbi:hypothetical protein EMPG_17644 [Blastomyces silverae]|uniref:Uncharacterized protein n=1 Tax=Blastomyces silverae TaxID=2060906 RepID=A0A0H1B613_9EURO|nr:hypothetical protein EMPG_17644 [Blastomyces silverae]